MDSKEEQDENSQSESSSYFDSDESLSEDNEREVSQGIVGEIYSNKYICIKYLGKGTFSRVWLVYDITTESFYAMKVVYSKYREDAEHEIEMYKALGNKYKYVTRYIDSFLLQDEVCIVMELMGICMIDLFKYYSDASEKKRKWYDFSPTSDLIPRNIVKKIFKDLFTGLHELHCKNIVHTDLKPENIMINIFPNKIVNVKEWFMESGIIELYKSGLSKVLPENFANSDPSKRKLIRKKGRIKVLNEIRDSIRKIIQEYHQNINNKNIATASNIIEIDDISDIETEIVSEGDLFTLLPVNEIQAKIIDLGNAEQIEDYEPDSIQLRCYRPPENVLHDFYNTKADIWTMGCILYETLTGEYLFEIDHEKFSDSLDRDKELLVQMYNIIGEMNIADVSRSIYNNDLFHNNSNQLLEVSSDRFNRTSIKELLKDSPSKIVGEDLSLLTDLFNQIFEYDLEKRLEASEILVHKWFLIN